MATNSKKAAKPSKSAKKAPGAVKKAPAKKAAPAKSIKKAHAKPIKKVVPAKKAVAKPVKKSVPVKKTAKPAPKKSPAKPIKKAIAKNNNTKTVNKKTSKPAPAKKATPVKKTAQPKKAAPAKKVAPAAKKVTPPAKAASKSVAKPVAKPAAKPVAKPVEKAPAKAAPAAKKAAPTPAASKDVKKKITISQLPLKAMPQVPKPTPTPAARTIEKKPQVIIAHRRLENKSKSSKESGAPSTQYHPETYRSILDEPIQQQQGPVYRYSDDELNEFKEIITSRLDAARKELLYLQGLITRKDEAGTEDTENRYMNMEDGSGAMEREQLAQLASRQIQFMNHLEKALVRIENKTYGICRVTGKLIDKARLRAVPHATLSIEAKKLMATKQV